MSDSSPWVHASADVEDGASIGDGSRVWDLAKVRSGAKVGSDCTIGRLAYIDNDVTVGSRCKIQNNALVYGPATISDGVFIGPAVVLTNDRHPRAITPDGEAAQAGQWSRVGVTICSGAALGAGSTVVSGVTIAEWALVAAGSVVAVDVPAHALVAGVPARQLGWVSRTGHRLVEADDGWECPFSGDRYDMIDDVMRRR